MLKERFLFPDLNEARRKLKNIPFGSRSTLLPRTNIILGDVFRSFSVWSIRFAHNLLIELGISRRSTIRIINACFRFISARMSL